MAKKVLRIFAIAIACILLLLIILPFALKGKIVDRVKTEINKNLNATVEFGNFGLSLIRNFPNATLFLNDLKIIGAGPFEKDTLAAIVRTAVTIDVFSLFRERGFEIKSIRLKNPDILLLVLPDGASNWDIMKVAEEETPEEKPFVLHLNQLRILGGNLKYHDHSLATFVDALGINATLRGDLSLGLTTIATRNATIGQFSLLYDDMPVLSKAAVNLTAEIEANLADMIFTFSHNEFIINELPVKFDGMIGLPGNDIFMDFSFAALRSDFKNFLSVIPAIYSKDFSSLKTSGSLELAGFVKGLWTDDKIPAFGLKIGIKDGMFQYPDLPAPVSNVQLSLSVSNPGGHADFTVTDIPLLTMDLGGNPVEARLNLKTPLSDPQIDAKVKGRLDLGQIGRFYPLDGETTLRGVIESDLEARGRMSAIENKRHHDFFAQGHFKINDLFLAAGGLPQNVEISRGEFLLSPQFISVPSFSMKLGQSDLAASGRIDNLLGFLLSDQLLSGSFNTTSTFFNLNQLMEGMPESKPDEPMNLSVIKVPANIDFTLASTFERLLFGNLNISNVHGLVRVAGSQATLQNLRMSLLGGSLALNGTYSTINETPELNIGLNISQFDIQQAFNAFNTIQLLAPIGRYAMGSFSANFNLNALLNNNLAPLLHTLAGSGTLSSPSLMLKETPALSKLSELTMVEEFRNLSVRNLMLSFGFQDGRVDVKPFNLNFGQSTATVSGSNFFDKTIHYVLNVQMPRAQFGGAANRVLDNLVSQAAGKGLSITPGQTVFLDVIIKGNFASPEVSFGLSGVVDDLVNQLRDQLQQKLTDTRDQVRDQIQNQAAQVRDSIEGRVRETVEEARQKAQAELDARAGQIMTQANRQADNIRNEAGSAAERIRAEARQQALRLENEASGPIARAAAQRAGQALIREADQRAANLEAEAERNAQRIMSEAQIRSDRIRAGLE